ncbi:NAD(P)/FAD-dependent oxidoreductase [Arthrobacter echini]|uniref:NAD(P)/FAD-dependent oxidoreductase n=1 Tax=Arthrobacter echini TaxID=1529066 RepID=A0A4S5E9M1_9MICC|nr:FAD-dependent oxidoreductase [Arthrobacter echini]THJ68358.1 NAD(P)/FAD-dependent oxidoreductase [Arthrobacter echini]
METLAVVGASLAGLSAARAARARGFAGRLIMIGDEHHRPYDRPPLSKDFLLGRIRAEDLLLESDPAEIEAEWVLGTAAVALDTSSRTLLLENGRALTADGIVIATGARARTLPALSGLDNVHTLRSLPDAQRLAPALRPGGRLVVIGAGFVGAEVASAAVLRGMRVTVIDTKPLPFVAQLGPDMGGVLAALHAANGVELISSAVIEGFETAGSGVTAVRLEDGRRVAADVVVVGVGSDPNTEWLESSGVALDRGVLCDAMGRTGVPGIAAVGDCAAWFDPATGRHCRAEHWTGASERAGLAVEALLAPDAPTKPSAPHYFWSDQYGVRLQFVGDATGYDRLEIEAGDLTTTSFLAVYYRGSTPIAVLGLDQPKLFTRRRRGLALRAPVSELVPA